MSWTYIAESESETEGIGCLRMAMNTLFFVQSLGSSRSSRQSSFVLVHEMPPVRFLSDDKGLELDKVRTFLGSMKERGKGLELSWYSSYKQTDSG